MTAFPDVSPELTTWVIDVTHSSVRFSIRHLVISHVHGRFGRWAGVVTFDDAHPERTQVDVQIAAASVDTNEPRRDQHLRSAEFLDTDRHPEITFRSRRVERTGTERYRLAGDLTIAGIMLPVALAIELLGYARDSGGGERVVFSGTTRIDRRDFGLVWNESLQPDGVLLGDRVEISVDVEAVRAVRPPSTQAA
jgi:polyisoprenoid-binding protein YceI